MQSATVAASASRPCRNRSRTQADSVGSGSGAPRSHASARSAANQASACSSRPRPTSHSSHASPSSAASRDARPIRRDEDDGTKTRWVRGLARANPRTHAMADRRAAASTKRATCRRASARHWSNGLCADTATKPCAWARWTAILPPSPGRYDRSSSTTIAGPGGSVSRWSHTVDSSSTSLIATRRTRVQEPGPPVILASLCRRRSGVAETSIEWPADAAVSDIR